MQSQKAVTAHFSSEQLLLFGFVACLVQVACFLRGKASVIDVIGDYTRVQSMKGRRVYIGAQEPARSQQARSNVVLMLGRRRRRRANIKTTLDQRLVLASDEAAVN